MPIPDQIECWNCGKSYILANDECCPKCGEFHDDELCDDDMINH